MLFTLSYILLIYAFVSHLLYFLSHCNVGLEQFNMSIMIFFLPLFASLLIPNMTCKQEFEPSLLHMKVMKVWIILNHFIYIFLFLVFSSRRIAQHKPKQTPNFSGQ